MALDGDASFAFQIHIVKHLPFCYSDRLGMFKKTVGQGRFAMVNMGNNAEIPYMIHPFVYKFKVQI